MWRGVLISLPVFSTLRREEEAEEEEEEEEGLEKGVLISLLHNFLCSFIPYGPHIFQSIMFISTGFNRKHILASDYLFSIPHTEMKFQGIAPHGSEAEEEKGRAASWNKSILTL